jgi:hypothetical protein
MFARLAYPFHPSSETLRPSPIDQTSLSGHCYRGHAIFALLCQDELESFDLSLVTLLPTHPLFADASELLKFLLSNVLKFGKCLVFFAQLLSDMSKALNQG